MRAIVPRPVGWPSLPTQTTRSPDAILRATAVFMTISPFIARDNEIGSMGDAQGTAQPFPLWRLRSGRDVAHRSMFGYRPPNISTLTMLKRCAVFRVYLWLSGLASKFSRCVVRLQHRPLVKEAALMAMRMWPMSTRVNRRENAMLRLSSLSTWQGVCVSCTAFTSRCCKIDQN
jgi:hypothetical protein